MTTRCHVNCRGRASAPSRRFSLTPRLVTVHSPFGLAPLYRLMGLGGGAVLFPENAGEAALPVQPIHEERRREIFLALVEAQGQEMAVGQSRKVIAERFGVTEGQVRKIEQEGLDKEWPPL